MPKNMRQGEIDNEKIKYMLEFILICTLAFGMTACGKKVVNEEQIKQELESKTKFQFLKEKEQIEEVVIEKRQTEKDQKFQRMNFRYL